MTAGNGLHISEPGFIASGSMHEIAKAKGEYTH